MNAIKYRTTVKNGKLDLPLLDLPEGTVVEAILLVDQSVLSELDEMSYLFSSDANRPASQQTLKHLPQEIFASTQGSWSHQTRDEIDAQLAFQRQLDWGE